MSCNLADEELWSGLDRNDPQIHSHLNSCPDCRSRAAEINNAVIVVSTSSRPNEAPLPGLIGPYRILRRLGSGGMGVVYEGEQEAPKRRVAIKVIRGDSNADPFRIKLFQREAQALARLKHPAIAAIYEAGQSADNQHFFAMEFVEGVPLNEHVRITKSSLKSRLELFRRVSEAISYAHQRGVIHRDLKPTNVLIDASGNPKILDFGLARISEPDSGHSVSGFDVGKVMGTLAYMSPEEIRGQIERIDVRSDVYSLGVILYELLTERLPYSVSRSALPEAVRVICDEAPKRPSLVHRAVRGDLETIILCALQKEPELRYQTAAELSEDIGRFLTNQPIRARSASLPYRFRKFLARHKIACGVAMVLVGIVASAWTWVHQAERRFQEQTNVRESLAELRVALMSRDLAELHHQNKIMDKAVGNYREALSTFRRLQRMEPRYAGVTMLGLAEVLLVREGARIEDVREAKGLLMEAEIIFRSAGPEWEAQRRKAEDMLNRLLSHEGDDGGD